MVRTVTQLIPQVGKEISSPSPSLPHPENTNEGGRCCLPSPNVVFHLGRGWGWGYSSSLGWGKIGQYISHPPPPGAAQISAQRLPGFEGSRFLLHLQRLRAEQGTLIQQGQPV